MERSLLSLERTKSKALNRIQEPSSIGLLLELSQPRFRTGEVTNISISDSINHYWFAESSINKRTVRTAHSFRQTSCDNGFDRCDSAHTLWIHVAQSKQTN